jgi:D-beta-D-heptose 7-phosphate kinase/D-beta-D-heptose 1-phosphate adenosyltransferase
VERISPEAPVPVVQIRRQQHRPGGAANVALNVQSIGGSAVVTGMVGDDSDGRDLLSVLSGKGIVTDNVVAFDGMRTTVKTRVLADRQQVVRIDREDPPEAIAGKIPELCAKIQAAAESVDAIVIEDYGKGVITAEVASACAAAARRCSLPVGFDPKDNHDLPVRGITIATPNYREACSAAGVRETPLGDELEKDARLLEIARRLRQKWETKLLAITLGAHGMFLLENGDSPVVIPARAREVFDVSGAGDTVIAVAVLSLAAGATYYEAAALANFAAGVVVGKIGTASCSAAELLGSID